MYRILLVLLLLAQPAAAGEPTTIWTNRKLEVIKPRKGLRSLYRQAGKLLGDWTIVVSGMQIDGSRLVELSKKSPKEPFVRVVREDFRFPVDVNDFVYFLDDVLREGKKGLRGKVVWVLPGRGRAAGLLVHPDGKTGRGCTGSRNASWPSTGRSPSPICRRPRTAIPWGPTGSPATKIPRATRPSWRL